MCTLFRGASHPKLKIFKMSLVVSMGAYTSIYLIALLYIQENLVCRFTYSGDVISTYCTVFMTGDYELIKRSPHSCRDPRTFYRNDPTREGGIGVHNIPL